MAVLRRQLQIVVIIIIIIINIRGDPRPVNCLSRSALHLIDALVWEMESVEDVRSLTFWNDSGLVKSGITVDSKIVSNFVKWELFYGKECWFSRETLLY